MTDSSSSSNVEVISEHQIPMETHYPHEGWVEQDPMEILDTVKQVVKSL